MYQSNKNHQTKNKVMEIKLLYKSEEDYNFELEGFKTEGTTSIISASLISKQIHLMVNVDSMTPKFFSENSKGKWIWARVGDDLKTITWNWTTQKEFILIRIGDIVKITASAGINEGVWGLNLSTQLINYKLTNENKGLINAHFDDWKNVNNTMNETLYWINTNRFSFINL